MYTESLGERKVQTDCVFNTFDLILMQGLAANFYECIFYHSNPRKDFSATPSKRGALNVTVIIIFITNKNETKNLVLMNWYINFHAILRLL